MPQKGTLVVRVFTSRAQLPVEGAIAAVATPAPDGRQNLVSVMRTNASGVTQRIALDAPDNNLSTDPGSARPFAQYNLVVEHPNYLVAQYTGLQIFAGIETVQEVSLIPAPLPEGAFSPGTVTVPPQSL